MKVADGGGGKQIAGEGPTDCGPPDRENSRKNSLAEDGGGGGGGGGKEWYGWSVPFT